MAENGKFRLGVWTVEPALDRISQGQLRHQLRPQLMNILVYLAHHPKEVVSVEELLERVWGGRVVTSASIYSALNQLREALCDDVHDAKYIQTIPRRGYRLIADVEFLDEPVQAVPDFAITAVYAGSKRWPSIAMALTVLVIVTYLAFSYRAQKTADAAPPDGMANAQSVAVLPFADMSLEQDNGWFGDGIAEEILNKLAQVPGLKVSGRTSSFAFRGSEEDIQTIGRTLGVDHLLEGSVRRDGDHLRVIAQLIKASDGFHVWSQEYDREVTEVLAIQDDIAGNIASALQLELVADKLNGGAAASKGYYPDFTAYELYLQALEMMHHGTGESLTGALAKLEKALERDPEFAAAHLAMAKTYNDLYLSLTFYQGDGIEKSRALMRPHLEKALAIDPELAEAYVVQTWLFDDDDQTEASLRKAISLNPNLAIAHQELGNMVSSSQYSWEEAIKHMEKALELEPLSLDAAATLVEFLQFLPYRRNDALAIIENLKQYQPEHPTTFMLEGQWLLAGGRLAEAVPLLEKAVVADPDSFISRQLLTITWFSLGETGRAMESQYQVNQWLMVLAPDRDRSLEQLRARTYTDRLIDFDYRALDAYVYLMLHEWQSAIDNMAPYLADLDDFRHQCEMMCGKRYSPAISLATAYHALGDKAHFQDFLAIEQEAMNTRSENGRIHNTEYSRTFSRINVLQGRPYEAMLELERLVTTGPLDPRELMHPAFDILRDDPHFTRLEALQRSRVNAEREKLGLAPLPNGNSKGL